MYAAPVDKTVFQTVVFGLICWWFYTFLYKPVVYGPDPLTFTTDEVIRIIHTVVNDSCKNELSREKYTDDIDDAASTLISLKHKPA